VATDQKRARAKSAWLVFFDESGISLIPPVRRTWARQGCTPILRHRMAWKRASVAAALGYRPDGTSARLCFHLQPDSYDTDSLIGVLEQLKGFYAGHQVVLLWDGLSAHWSHTMRAHLDAQRHWLRVERLPAYAPELNPVEGLWANLKGTELANCAGDTLAEVADRPTAASSESASATAWSSASWPTPACASTPSRHPNVKGSIRARFHRGWSG
jgi:DDE superfamily endonuclease